MEQLTRKESRDILNNGDGWDDAKAIKHITDKQEQKHSEEGLKIGDAYGNAEAMG